jgi:hypothetical protein
MFVLEATNDEIESFAHSCEVGSDIDRIRHNQKTDRHEHKRKGIEFLSIGRDTLTCDASDVRADELNGNHDGVVRNTVHSNP